MTARKLYFLGFLTCAALIATALYFQHVDGLEPCPLCIFQRVAFIAMGAVFLVACLHNPQKVGRMIYGMLLTLPGLFGAAISMRHVWLQNLPADQVPECGPSLDFMLDVFPLVEVFQTVLKGSGECAEISWTFLGLTMPGWSLVWMIGLLLLALWTSFSNRMVR